MICLLFELINTAIHLLLGFTDHLKLPKHPLTFYDHLYHWESEQHPRASMGETF